MSDRTHTCVECGESKRVEAFEMMANKRRDICGLCRRAIRRAKDQRIRKFTGKIAELMGSRWT